MRWTRLNSPCLQSTEHPLSLSLLVLEMPQSKSNLTIVLGTMTFGEEGKEQARVHDLPTVKAICQCFLDHGHTETDSARFYCGGTCEEYLGKIEADKMGLTLQTKLYPTVGRTMTPGAQPVSHSPEDLRKHLMISLQALGVKKLDMFYLHGPDRTTPYEVTLKAVNDLHKEGYFDRFGISNYMSWEVAEMVTICRQNGWIQPTVYQGLYNVIHRSVETELFPCLRKFGISFYAYNPLGGGYLTGRYSKETMNAEVEKGSRFDPDRWALLGVALLLSCLSFSSILLTLIPSLRARPDGKAKAIA